MHRNMIGRCFNTLSCKALRRADFARVVDRRRVVGFPPACCSLSSPRRLATGGNGDALIRDFADQFEGSFPEERAHEHRHIGREAEYPVVWSDGSAADVRLLLSKVSERNPGMFRSMHESAYDRLLSSRDNSHLVGLLSNDGGTELTLEVGWGTVEIATSACRDLFELRSVHDEALSLVVDAADSLGMHLLGYGMQPRTEPSLQLLSPKARYAVLKKVIGEDWLSFTITASDQLHVDVAKDELVDVLNVSNMMSAVVIALCGNSSVYAGQQSAFSSTREGLMLSNLRHGVPSRPFRSVSDYVDRLCDLPFLMTPTANGWVPVGGGKTFREYAEQHGTDWAGFLAHDHYVWYSARARTKQRTVELRSACQQPYDGSDDAEHMAAAALQLAVVEATEPLRDLVIRKLGGDTSNSSASKTDENSALERGWAHMLALRRHALRHGLGRKSTKTAFEDVVADNNSLEDPRQKRGTITRDLWIRQGYDEDDFDSLDRNRDGVIDEHEWNAAALPKRLREAAAHNDVNKLQRLLVGLPHDDVVAAVLAASRQDDDALKSLLDVRSADFASSAINFHDLIRDVLDVCEDALHKRGLGEEVFMKPLFRRLEAMENPGQKLRAVASRDGLLALVEHARIQKRT